VAVLKKYNLAGKEVGQVAIEDELLKGAANTQMIKDYIVAIHHNARQWSANTKTRAEVCHSGKKPHPQKGTGNARQGYLGAPQYKGGGRVHAPRPKFEQNVRINRKEKRAAIRHLLIEKLTANQVHVLEYQPLKEPKTKSVASFLKSLKIDRQKVLFLGEGFISGKEADKAPKSKFENFMKSLRNIAKNEFAMMPNISGLDVISATHIVVMDTAVDQLKVLLGGQR